MPKPKPIPRSRLWLHLDPSLHPETNFVIDHGHVYRNNGVGFTLQREATPEDYDRYAEVVDA